MPHPPPCAPRDGARLGHAPLRLARPGGKRQGTGSERHDARLVSGPLTLRAQRR
jgi:hypothetical protein